MFDTMTDLIFSEFRLILTFANSNKMFGPVHVRISGRVLCPKNVLVQIEYNLKEETFAVQANRETFTFRGNKRSRMTSYEKFRGNKLSG